MREARLTVRACGPLVSYQDGGRFGMLRFGVPASGAMDRLAHAAAQIALGRPEGATAIEVSLGGLALVCDTGEVPCCVTGGGFQVVLNGAVSPSWCVRPLRAGDELAFQVVTAEEAVRIVLAQALARHDWLREIAWPRGGQDVLTSPAAGVLAGAA